MILLQINTVANSGSTGRIAEGIGFAAQNAGYHSCIAYGRYANPSVSQLIKIGSRIDQYEHALETRLFDNHGLASRNATRDFISQIDRIHPAIVHLHNIHGYYINYEILFNYFKRKKTPVVWTLHDCWPFTGHCSYFTIAQCVKWKTQCSNCPIKSEYPQSFFANNAANNFKRKKNTFTSLKSITIVSVSHWLDDLVSQSFLKDSRHLVIHNGIDTDAFAPSFKAHEIREKCGVRDNEMMLLGVASVWSDRKGLHDFLELAKSISPDTKLVLIGLSPKIIRKLPENVVGIERTESVQQLSDYYSAADLFLNLTYEDNYPTTNLEAVSCGTPCLTYRTGGSPESISAETGFVTAQGDFNAILDCIKAVKTNGKRSYSVACRNYALTHFRQEDCFRKYIDLYKQMCDM